MARGRARSRAHGIAQAHDRRDARVRRRGSRVARQGRGGPRRGHHRVTESKALAGRIAIVTGGTRGIGLAIARALAEDGASVVVSGRDAARLESAAREIESVGAVALAVAADQSKREDCDRLLEATKERFGRIDVLLNKAAARELAHWNILVNAVAPGLIETDMTAGISGEAREGLLKQVPLKRIGAAREVAEVVRFLAGDGAAYITGQTIHVNGGLYM